MNDRDEKIAVTASQESQTHHNVDGIGFYLLIYVLLMALLIATVAAARLDIGSWNVVVALLIATIKAILVILFFMHLKAGPRLLWIFSAAAFLWLGLLLSLTMTDYSGRERPTPNSLAHVTAELGATAIP